MPGEASAPWAGDRYGVGTVLGVLGVPDLGPRIPPGLLFPRHADLVRAWVGSSCRGSSWLGCASVGCASVGCASVGCASVGCASVGCASVGCASVGCIPRERAGAVAVWAGLPGPGLAGLDLPGLDLPGWTCLGWTCRAGPVGAAAPGRADRPRRAGPLCGARLCGVRLCGAGRLGRAEPVAGWAAQGRRALRDCPGRIAWRPRPLGGRAVPPEPGVSEQRDQQPETDQNEDPRNDGGCQLGPPVRNSDRRRLHGAAGRDAASSRIRQIDAYARRTRPAPRSARTEQPAITSIASKISG